MTLRSTIAIRSRRQFWDSFVSVLVQLGPVLGDAADQLLHQRAIDLRGELARVPSSSSSSYAGPPFIARCSK